MKQLLENLLGQSLRDIILSGVVDLNSVPADFIPLLDRVYLEVGQQLVELSRDEQTLQLDISFVDEDHLDCEMEDTQRFCRSSIGRYVLTDPLADNRIAFINMYAGPNDSVEALEFNLVSGQMLFFDPSFVDGVNFGGVEQKATWLDNSAENNVTFIGPIGESKNGNIAYE